MPDPIPAWLVSRDAALQSFLTAAEALGVVYEEIRGLDQQIEEADGRWRLPMAHVQLQQPLQACLCAQLPGVVPANACSERKAVLDRAAWLAKVLAPA